MVRMDSVSGKFTLKPTDALWIIISWYYLYVMCKSPEFATLLWVVVACVMIPCSTIFKQDLVKWPDFGFFVGILASVIALAMNYPQPL